MMYLINEKFDQQIQVWDILLNIDNNQALNLKKLNLFFHRLFQLKLKELNIFLSNNEQSQRLSANRRNFIIFLINCLSKMENIEVRKSMIKLIGLPIWSFIHENDRQNIFQMAPVFSKKWQKCMFIILYNIHFLQYF